LTGYTVSSDTELKTTHYKLADDRELMVINSTCLTEKEDSARVIATCVNYADLNNSMLCMHGHVSAGFSRCDVLFLQGKQNGFCHVVASA